MSAFRSPRAPTSTSVLPRYSVLLLMWLEVRRIHRKTVIAEKIKNACHVCPLLSLGCSGGAKVEQTQEGKRNAGIIFKKLTV